ncbi:MAG: orotidine-5'-phosphate decarboxylase [Planctomycetota bacterium]
MRAYADRLAEAIARKGCPIAVGIDPRPERLPPALLQPPVAPLAAVEAFCRGLIDCLSPVVPAIKIQVAFFERFLGPGMELYFRMIATGRAKGLLVIGDVKRGDIGSTAEAYAQAHLASRDAADAITVNPYFGTDGVTPFLEAAAKHGRGLYVLVKTTNPSSVELQDLQVSGGPLFEQVAVLVNRWGEAVPGTDRYSSVGAVAGGTHSEALRRLRLLLPRTPLLVPGFGAQGARAGDVVGAFDERGDGALIASSRGVAQAFEGQASTDPRGAPRWQDRVREAAEVMREELRAALRQRGS